MRDKSNATTIAFLGFGELGQRFARDFAARGDIRLVAYDILLDRPETAGRIEGAARTTGADVAGSAARALAGADIVFSAVTADQAYAIAAATVPLLQPGQVFVDVNSASPGTKARAASLINATGAHYIEAAVIGPIQKFGIKVEILTGGPEAASVASRLNALGMIMTPVATGYGRASATKLCRSIMIKGIEALMVDCARASAHWGVEEPVFASLARTFPGNDWMALAIDMAERVATHGVRRSAEMREAADMVREMGLDPALTSAVADAQLKGAKPKA